MASPSLCCETSITPMQPLPSGMPPADLLQLSEDPARFLSLAELNQDWSGLCGELSPEELEQIRYWNPQTVGEIVFNAWD